MSKLNRVGEEGMPGTQVSRNVMRFIEPK